MDESQDKPLAFSDRALDQYTKSFLAEDEDLPLGDRTVMKVTFRSMGGQWEDVVQGKSEAIQLLSKVVEAWAKTRSAPKK